MSGPDPNHITDLLCAWREGDAEALELLVRRVHPHLSLLAARALRRERRNHTLETGALVNEAFLRLSSQERVLWRNRNHFYAICAQFMRRILVDHERRRRTEKRGSELRFVAMGAWERGADGRHPDLLALDDALRDLEAFDPALAEIVILRYFGGLTKAEAAETLQVSESSVARRWRTARAWLYDYLEQEALP